MEPVDYLKIFKNHWKVVAALVVLAAAAIFFTSPKTPGTAYVAEHKLLLVQGTGGTSSMANVATVAELTVQNPTVMQRAAEQLGEGFTAEDVAANVDAEGNLDLLIITIRGHGSTPQEAMGIANAVGEEVIAYVDEREAQRIEGEVARNQEEQNRIEDELAQVRAELQANPGNTELEGREDALITALGNNLTLEDQLANTARYQSELTAEHAEEDASFVAGFGREQRAIFAAVVALIAGFGVAIMLDRSDSRLRTKDQVERRFGLPVLAEVPMLALRDRSRAAVVAFEREPRVAEAYRGLRTALLLYRGRSDPAQGQKGNGRAHLGVAQPSGMRQLVVVTSPEAGDGKSTSAANLAMAYAETGQSVLLISWDLWRPLSPGVFDAQEGPGVADYLNGNASSLVRYVQDTSIPGVRIVTAGLGGHHTYTQIDNARRLLEEARTLANVVIVDTAPILSASVTRELVTLADAVVVVCRAGRTTGPVADRCAELLERVGAPALGVVLVGVATGPFADYYGAPPSEGRTVARTSFSRRGEEPGPRHKAPAGAPVRPTSAQYRATTPRGSEGREPR